LILLNFLLLQVAVVEAIKQVALVVAVDTVFLQHTRLR
jgi:hypothetical protein